MFVGPFIYFDNPRVSQERLAADLCPLEGAAVHGRKRKSAVTHLELMSAVMPGEDPKAFPRGEVVFCLDSQMAIIYIDRCIEKYLDQVVSRFELPAWVIEYDERFVCPRCDRLADQF